jgi:hypothetical protein
MNGIILATVIVNILIARRIARHEVRYANEVWVLTNTILVVHNFRIGEYEQMIMFTIFWYYSLKGVAYNLKQGGTVW